MKRFTGNFCPAQNPETGRFCKKKIEISQSLFIFQHIKPAHLEFTVKADLFIEPDGVFLLEGGKATLKLFEKSGLKDSTGEPIKRGN